MTTPAYDQLRAHARETGVLNAVEALLGWDQETFMPSAGAAPSRALPWRGSSTSGGRIRSWAILSRRVKRTAR